MENILGDEAHTGDDEHEVVDSKPDLRELILWLGIDLIAQSPEDIMADGGRALVENCRSFPWPEIVGEFFKRLSGYAEIIAAFE